MFYFLQPYSGCFIHVFSAEFLLHTCTDYDVTMNSFIEYLYVYRPVGYHNGHIQIIGYPSSKTHCFICDK